MTILDALKQIDPHPKAIYRITVDGKDISATLDGRLVSLTLADNRGFEADQLDIALDDTDGKLDLPPRGAIISVAFGWESSGLVEKGTFTVDEIEHTGTPDTLTIRARSADLRAGLTTQRERSWHDTTLGAIVSTIADECGLGPMISIGLADKTIDHIDQTNETAANLLTRLAQQHDAISTVKNGQLLFISAAAGVSASGKPLPAITIERQSGDQHRFSLADRETYTAVRATWNDLGSGTKGEVVWGKDEDSSERKVPAKPAPVAPVGQYKEVGKTFESRGAALKAAKKQWQQLKANKAQRADYIGVKAKYDDWNLGASGEVSYGQVEEDKARATALKQSAKDAKKNAALQPDEAPISRSTENAKTLRHVYASKENAARAARAEWRRLQRGMSSFGITLAKGRPELFPELPATISGFKPAIDNTDWIIIKVNHSLTDAGLSTSLELEIRATEILD